MWGIVEKVVVVVFDDVVGVVLIVFGSIGWLYVLFFVNVLNFVVFEVVSVDVSV